MPRTTKNGWVGVDVGASTVKVAQVVRRGDGWQIHAAAAVPRKTAWDARSDAAPIPASSAHEILAAAALGEPWLGRAAAVSMSATACDLHSVTLPPSADGRQPQDVAQCVSQITNQPMRGRLVDWRPVAAEQRDGQPAIVATIPETWSHRLAVDLARTRWQCRTIDALPWSLARAMGLTAEHRDEGNVAALDWGHAACTCCLFRGGAPVCVRRISGAGLGKAIEAVADALGVNPRDAQVALRQRGVANDAKPGAATVARAVSTVVERLESELIRTLQFWRNKTRGEPIASLTLFGGGATISGIEARLTRSLDLPVRKWRLTSAGESRAAGNAPDECLLGPALGLSALAWEQS